MIQAILKLFDKILGTLGEKKAQKGFFVTAITAVIIKFYPDFPQEDWTKIVEFVVQILNGAGAVWVSLGVVHQFIKDKILAGGAIPESVKKLAAEGKEILIVKSK